MRVFSAIARQQTPPSGGWTAALARNERWLRAVILARSGDRAAVDEIWQEVAMAAVGTTWGSVPQDRLGPWLYQVAVRQSLLHRRKLGRRRRLLTRAAAAGDARVEQPDPLQWLLAEEQRDQVQIAVQRLHPRDAEILLLKYQDDWSYRDIAQHLGVSESAVEARLHRARQRLRSQLAAFQMAEAPL